MLCIDLHVSRAGPGVVVKAACLDKSEIAASFPALSLIRFTRKKSFFLAHS